VQQIIADSKQLIVNPGSVDLCGCVSVGLLLLIVVWVRECVGVRLIG